MIIAFLWFLFVDSGTWSFRSDATEWFIDNECKGKQSRKEASFCWLKIQDSLGINCLVSHCYRVVCRFANRICVLPWDSSSSHERMKSLMGATRQVSLTRTGLILLLPSSSQLFHF
jgi:hypothetical protein